MFSLFFLFSSALSSFLLCLFVLYELCWAAGLSHSAAHPCGGDVVGGAEEEEAAWVRQNKARLGGGSRFGGRQIRLGIVNVGFATCSSQDRWMCGVRCGRRAAVGAAAFDVASSSGYPRFGLVLSPSYWENKLGRWIGGDAVGKEKAWWCGGADRRLGLGGR